MHLRHVHQELDLPDRHQDEVEEVEDEVGPRHGEAHQHLGPLRLQDQALLQSRGRVDIVDIVDIAC